MTSTGTDAKARALDLLATFVLEDGRRWGEAAVPVQWADADAVLDPDTTRPYSWISRARGYSKTSDLAALTVAAMLEQLPPGARCYALASDQDQARLLVDAIRGFATRTPGLAGALSIDSYRVTATRSGVVLDALAADAAGAWGLRPSWVVVDELCQWPSTPQARTLFEAVTTALPKVRRSRMAIISTSGSPGHWSKGVYDLAVADDLWRVSETHGPAPWMDGKRLAAERRRLPDSSYLRLFENEWCEPEDSLAAGDALAACVRLDGPLEPVPGRRYVIGVDVGLRNDRTVLAIAHAEPRPDAAEGSCSQVVVLDRMLVWAGTRANPVQLDEVEVALLDVWRRYNRAAVTSDPYQAVQLLQRVRAKGVKATEYAFTTGSISRLAQRLYLQIRDSALSLPDDSELLSELANVRLRETSPNVYRLDHASGAHDDRAVALALCCVYLDDHMRRPQVDLKALGEGMERANRSFEQVNPFRIA